MIDLAEHLLTLNDAARSLPGGGVHISTLHRWRLRGVRGIRLETILRGGVRFTSVEALERFITATTAIADRSPLIRTSRQQKRAIREALAELDAAGL